jgi:hypothetical protein
MIRRTPFALGVLIALALIPAPAVFGATTPVKLRVLTPQKVLDPGTTYYVPDSVSVKTSPDADCFGPPGGSGASASYDTPNALSVLASAASADKKIGPLLLTDQFGFGLGICGIGGQEAKPGQSFWYFKLNHEESATGADQTAVRKGDEALFYLAPDDFPNPNPAELELSAPAGVKAGGPFSIKVIEHKCVTDQTTFETTCSSGPANGVKVTGGDETATTGPDGTATVIIGDVGVATLQATRGTDIPSEALETCVGPERDSCPKERGERIVGSAESDKIKGTSGLDEIRALAGNDKIDARKGGADTINCGAGKDTVQIKRKTAGAGLVIKGNCEKVKH